MLGLFVILGASWLLLYLLEGKSLKVLGLLPTPKGILHFFIGFLFMGFINLILIGFQTLLLSVEWEFNAAFDLFLILKSFGWHLQSAFTEDLLFRGAILYILISKLDQKKALAISAIAFGIYHWFSYGMFGAGLVPMIYIFVITGSMGFAWAYSFAKTNSMLLPLGLHLGWNFVTTLFIENQPFGELLFSIVSSTELSELDNLFYMFGKGLVPPILTFFFVKAFFVTKKENKRVLNVID